MLAKLVQFLKDSAKCCCGNSWKSSLTHRVLWQITWNLSGLTCASRKWWAFLHGIQTFNRFSDFRTCWGNRCVCVDPFDSCGWPLSWVCLCGELDCSLNGCYADYFHTLSLFQEIIFNLVISFSMFNVSITEILSNKIIKNTPGERAANKLGSYSL